MKKFTVLFLFIFLGISAFSQSVTRQQITAITESENTGQDYTPWLNDNLDDLITNVWTPANSKYVDVTLKLASRTAVTKIGLYDHEGIFIVNPAYVYAQDGTQKTLIGMFTGLLYKSFVYLNPAQPIMADAIVIHKFSNNIPQKVQVYGQNSTSSVPAPLPGLLPIPLPIPSPILLPIPLPVTSILYFPPLTNKTAGDTSFNLTAASNNKVTPITFTSSNPAVVSVSNISGTWKATPVAAGSAIITAYQAAGKNYLAAVNVTRTQVVLPAPAGTTDPVEPDTTDTKSKVKITIEPKRWYQLNNTSNTLEALFDGNTNVGVKPSWGLIFSNFDAYYPLLKGEEMTIKSIKFFDGSGTYASAPMTLSVINEKWQKIPIATFTGKEFNKWVGPYPDRSTAGDNMFNLDVPIKNIRFLVINTNVAYPTEIELYGSYKPAVKVAPLTRKPGKLKEVFGVNAFEWVFEHPNRPTVIDEERMDAIKAFSGVRHYMDWQKLELTEGKYTFNPVHSGGWNYDAIYERCKAENIEVLACLKTIPDWMKNTYPYDQRDLENVPLKYGKDYSAPNSYIEQAKVAFQYIARYGSNPNVDLSLLSVNSNPRWGADAINVVKRGMGVIKYIECENERDKWWKGRKAYQTGREYAANLSAFFDGHKNTMGPGVGVKNADPNIKVVMGGVAKTSTDYLKGMIDWCKQYRGYNADGTVNLCWDVINYHLYSNDAKSSQDGNSTRGAAPEVSEAKKVAEDFLKVAHEYANDMPVWITETGYDVNQGSPLKAIKIGNKSVLQTQADWILRTALLYARTGVEKVFFYQLYDDNPESTIKFSSMGLINDNKRRKPAADFIFQTKKLFGEYTYKETLNGEPIVDRYELNSKSMYSLVVPDEKGRSVDNFELDLNGADSAIIFTPTIGSDDMSTKKVKLKNGKLIITVTETPVFVTPAGEKSKNLKSKASNSFTSAENDSEISVQLFPNPATQYLNVEVKNKDLSLLNIRIIDQATGRVSKTFNLQKTSYVLRENINLTSLPNGMYTLQIIQNNNKTVRNFLKLDSNNKL